MSFEYCANCLCVCGWTRNVSKNGGKKNLSWLPLLFHQGSECIQSSLIISLFMNHAVISLQRETLSSYFSSITARKLIFMGKNKIKNEKL